MTASAVRPSWLIPVPRSALQDLHLDTAPGRIDPVAGRAVAYQRVLHQMVRRELRMLADLASWAPPGEGERTLALTCHSELISRVLLDPGDRVWMEEPGYPGARSALLGAGARIVPVPVDAEGLAVETGARGAGDARLAYVTPSHQYPLGVPMSLPRRLALLRWASRAGAWVIEDDYDSEFRYGARPVPCLHGLDVDGRVIYVGSFSKTLFPALRLGFLVVPPDLQDGLQAGFDPADVGAGMVRAPQS